MVKTESEADLTYLDKLIERNPEYTKRDLSAGEPVVFALDIACYKPA